MYEKSLVCKSCGKSFSAGRPVVNCENCGGLLEVTYDYEKLSSKIDMEEISQRPKDIWRYGEFLPLCFKPNTLGEGGTPLVDSFWFGEKMDLDLKFKLDFLNPTGSFKDRGTAVAAAKAKELDQTKVADDSSGNAGSSLAAYGSRFGLDTVIYVPKGAPEDKLAQIGAYGADLKKIPGPRDEARKAIKEDHERGDFYYASHNRNPFFVEGTKTIAFEIFEQLGGRPPAHLLVPVGGGSLLLGAYKGFCELKSLGLIDEIPAIHFVQSSACDPLAKAFRSGKKEPMPVEQKETVAGGIHIKDPPRGRKILEAVGETGGQGLSVPEEDILEARNRLSRREGIFAEPTSAVPLLGLEELVRKGLAEKDGPVILPLTGFGLKDKRT